MMTAGAPVSRRCGPRRRSDAIAILDTVAERLGTFGGSRRGFRPWKVIGLGRTL